MKVGSGVGTLVNHQSLQKTGTRAQGLVHGQLGFVARRREKEIKVSIAKAVWGFGGLVWGL